MTDMKEIKANKRLKKINGLMKKINKKIENHSPKERYF